MYYLYLDWHRCMTDIQTIGDLIQTHPWTTTVKIENKSAAVGAVDASGWAQKGHQSPYNFTVTLVQSCSFVFGFSSNDDPQGICHYWADARKSVKTPEHQKAMRDFFCDIAGCHHDNPAVAPGSAGSSGAAIGASPGPSPRASHWRRRTKIKIKAPATRANARRPALRQKCPGCT